jgi:acetylornithine deacetylase/succinyl-diaminopimelate desuccinylase-like protein
MTDTKREFDAKTVKSDVEKEFKETIIPSLIEYIKVPNQSPLFDKKIHENGLMQKAIGIMVDWVKSQKIDGLSIQLVEEKNRTPVIFIVVEGSGTSPETVLLYGHCDKQPPLHGEWSDGLSPYDPIIKDGKLYGRGGADDGYAIFSAIAAIKALKKQGLPHARCVLLIEASEESGSPDLEFYVEKLKTEIGTPSLVVCLDSGCGNYEQLWLTTSLRGNITATLKVRILTEGVHSGAASGVVPSTFRILRLLMDRVEDTKTGKMLDEAYVEIPPTQLKYAEDMAGTIGEGVWKTFPWVEGGRPVSTDIKESILNRTWRPTLCVTGVGGIPNLSEAGNVLRQETQVKLSIRTPPTKECQPVIDALGQRLTSDPPYGAKVEFIADKAGQGWMAPPLEEWLETAVNKSSETYYGKPARMFGEGGSIPFMGMLGQKFPAAQFVVVGVLGPSANAHGPNEFLHLDMAKNLTCCVSYILYEHYLHKALKRKNPELTSTL